MIGYIEGIIKHKGINNILLLTNTGVGYKVFAPTDILQEAVTGQPFSVFIYTNVREDAIELYGFRHPDDLQLFEMFLGVSGIGPKTAMSVFSNGKVGKIREAVVKGDVDFFATVPRLGRKNAQKIIIELRPKISNLKGDLDLTADGTGETKEIIDALKTFGFSRQESGEALKFIQDVEGDTSQKIKAALKYLGGKLPK